MADSKENGSSKSYNGNNAYNSNIDPKEVTVAYIRENDFAPQHVRKYSPRSIPRPTRSTGRGYYLSPKPQSAAKKDYRDKTKEQNRKTTSRKETKKDLPQQKIDISTRAHIQKPIETESTQASLPDSREKGDDEREDTSVTEERNVFARVSEVGLFEEQPSGKACSGMEKLSEEGNREAGKVSAGGSKQVVATTECTSSEKSEKPAVPAAPSLKIKQSPVKTQILVEDTINSLVNLFGERKKQQGARGGLFSQISPTSSPCASPTRPTLSPPKTRVGTPRTYADIVKKGKKGTSSIQQKGKNQDDHVQLSKEQDSPSIKHNQNRTHEKVTKLDSIDKSETKMDTIESDKMKIEVKCRMSQDKVVKGKTSATRKSSTSDENTISIMSGTVKGHSSSSSGHSGDIRKKCEPDHPSRVKTIHRQGCQAREGEGVERNSQQVPVTRAKSKTESSNKKISKTSPSKKINSSQELNEEGTKNVDRDSSQAGKITQNKPDHQVKVLPESSPVEKQTRKRGRPKKKIQSVGGAGEVSSSNLNQEAMDIADITLKNSKGGRSGGKDGKRVHQPDNTTKSAVNGKAECSREDRALIETDSSSLNGLSPAAMERGRSEHIDSGVNAPSSTSTGAKGSQLSSITNVSERESHVGTEVNQTLLKDAEGMGRSTPKGKVGLGKRPPPALLDVSTEGDDTPCPAPKRRRRQPCEKKPDTLEQDAKKTEGQSSHQVRDITTETSLEGSDEIKSASVKRRGRKRQLEDVDSSVPTTRRVRTSRGRLVGPPARFVDDTSWGNAEEDVTEEEMPKEVVDQPEEKCEDVEDQSLTEKSSRSSKPKVIPPSTKKKTKATLLCTKCSRSFVSVAQHKRHEKWCGRESEETMCEDCGQNILSKNMKMHSTWCKSASQLIKTEQADQDGLEEDPPPKSRSRRAAQKAMSNIHDFIKSLKKTEKGADECRRPRYVLNKNRVISKYFVNKWMKDLDQGGKIKCPLHQCSYRSDSIPDMSVHYLSCTYQPGKRYYKCVKCNHKSATEKLARKHGRQHEWTDEESDNLSDMSSEVDDEDGDPDARFSGVDSEKDEDEGVSGSPSRRSVGHKAKPVGGIRVTRLCTERLELFQESMGWTLNWEQQNSPSDVELIHEWWPHCAKWQNLTKREAEKYLPAASVSPWFRYQSGQSKTEQRYLKRFEYMTKPITVMNAGGPVWSLDWLPRPLAEEHDQYLAVYSHRQHDMNHPTAEAISGPGTFQLWNLGTLTGDTEPDPKLELVVAHDAGAIWCLKWCPRRCWPHLSSVGGTKAAGDRLPWMGVVAAATSSGFIHIYSIPHPSALTKGRKDGELPVFKATPVLTLDSLTVGKEDTPSSGCHSLDWQLLNGCRYMLAGYSDGRVAMYDLFTTSCLLRSTTGGTVVVRPTVVFQAHQSCVTGVAFCKRRPGFFVTVSQDRVLKMWSQEHLCYPFSNIVKSEFTSVVWPLHWAAIFAATDNCYSLENNAMFTIDSGYFGIRNRPITVHNASIMDVTYSEWLNGVISVDSAGVVESFYLPYMMLSHKNHKAFSARRMVMYTAKLEPLQTCMCDKTNSLLLSSSSTSTDGSPVKTASSTLLQRYCCKNCQRPIASTQQVPAGEAHCRADDNSTSEVNSNRSPDEEDCSLLSSVKKVMNTMQQADNDPLHPHTVSEMIMQHALVFSDKEMDVLNTNRNKRISSARDLPSDTLLPPLAAQHKAQWNPNLGSHLWAAVAGEAGFVRIVYLTAFSSPAGEKFVESAFSDAST